MVKTGYAERLGEAFSLAFRNFQVFVPLIILLAFNFLSIPFYTPLFDSLSSGFSLGTFVLLGFYYLIISMVSLFVYSWLFVLIRQVVKDKKINIKRSYRGILPFAWKLFKIGLLLLVLMMALYVIFLILVVILGIFIALVPFIGIPLIILVVLAVSVVFWIYLFAMFPVIILEDKGAWETFASTFRNVWKDKKEYTLKFIATLPVLIVAYLPVFIFSFIFGLSNLGELMYAQSYTYSFIATVLGIPALVAMVVIPIFYCLGFKKK